MPWLKIHPWLIAETEERRRIRVIILRSRLYYKRELILKQAIKPSIQHHNKLQKSSINLMQLPALAQAQSSFLKAKHYKGYDTTGVQMHVRFRWQRQRPSQLQCNLLSIKEVKKSLYTLRRAAPSIFTDEMIDNIHEIIAKRRLNEKIRNSRTSDSIQKENKTASKMRVVSIKQEEPYISSSSASRSRSPKVKNTRTSKDQAEQQQQHSAELQNFWKEDRLKSLIDLYSQRLILPQIRDRLQLQYPEVNKFLTQKTFKRIIRKTTTAALRNLQNIIKKFEDVNLPKLVNINCKLISLIKDYSAAFPCRIKVLEVYTSDNVTSTLVREAIEAVNKYCHQIKHKE